MSYIFLFKLIAYREKHIKKRTATLEKKSSEDINGLKKSGYGSKERKSSIVNNWLADYY